MSPDRNFAAIHDLAADAADPSAACGRRCRRRPSRRSASLHLINGEHYAGAERVQDLLAQRLPEFGFRVGFACVKLDAFDAMRESRDAPLYDVPMRTRFDLRAAAQVARIVRDGRLSHSARAIPCGRRWSAAWRRRMAGVPMVYHAHSPTVAQHHPPLAGSDQRRRRAAEPAAASRG